METVLPDKILFAWHRNCNPELILKSYVSMGYHVVFRNKPLLHLWKSTFELRCGTKSHDLYDFCTGILTGIQSFCDCSWLSFNYSHW